MAVSPYLYVALGVTSLISEGLYGATSFGPAITFNIAWQVCHMVGLSDGTLSEAAVNLTFLETCSSALQILLLRKWISPSLALAISVPCCVFTALGQAEMLRLDRTPEGGAWLKRALGGVLLLMFVQRLVVLLLRRRRAAAINLSTTAVPAMEAPALPPPRPMRNWRTARVQASTFFWFALAGAMGGLTSVGGPPIMMWVSIHAHELNHDSWRGSNAVLRLLLNLSRGAVLAAEHRLSLATSYPLALVMLAGGWSGLLIGNALAPLFKDEFLLQCATLFMLLCGAALMEAAGFGPQVQQPVSVGVGGCAALVLLCALGRLAWRRCCARSRVRLREEGDSIAETRAAGLLANAVQ